MADLPNNGNQDGDSTLPNDNTIKVKLQSYDGNVHEVGLAAIQMSHLVKGMLEALNTGDAPPDYSKAIPIQNDGATDASLKKIIEWVEYHWDDPPVDEDFEDEKDRRSEELSHWDKQFIEVDDQGLLFDIIVAANYMDIKGLVEVGAKHICSKIKGKTCAEAREILKITNDFTPEEEEAIHKENEWIYAKD